jgi:hypothetical protein
MALKIAKGGTPSYFPESVSPVVAEVTMSKSVKGTTISETSKTEVVHPGQYIKQPHLVGVAGGRTINLGNFESARFDVSIQVPCNKEDLEAAYDFGLKFVSDRLEKIEAEAKGV